MSGLLEPTLIALVIAYFWVVMRQLELRMLAHYMNDRTSHVRLLMGMCYRNQNAAGLPTRDNAKTFIYAFLYGAGAAKIGKIVDGTAKDGKKLIDKFLSTCLHSRHYAAR